MPELAEVEWFRKQWNAGIGHEVVEVEAHSRKYVFRGTDGDALRENLIGQTLLRSKRSGKQMLFEFSENSWLGIHLGMTGKTHVESTDFRPGKHDHLVLVQRERALVFTDSRQLGHVRFHHGKDEPDWWKKSSARNRFTRIRSETFQRVLDRHRKAPIKAALLMQSGFPGIGNWMADEILWRAKVLPSRRIRKLTTRERAAIFRATKWVVRRSLETLGKDFSDPPKQLADSSKMETRWHLPHPSHSTSPRHRRRPHHRLVREVSEVGVIDLNRSEPDWHLRAVR